MADRPDPVGDLLGAYALDALDDHERRQVEEWLAYDPRTRDEVASHREVVAMLAFTDERPPEGLWERIAEAIEGEAPVPGNRLTHIIPGARRRRRRSVLAGGIATALAAAAAVAITVVVVLDDDPAPVAGGLVEQAYGEAWADPEGRRASLVSDDETLNAEAVVQTSGRGFLSAEALPELPVSQTYQLWGVYAGGDVISLGVIGCRPGIEPFTARGDIDAVVVTKERAGGVVSSTSGALLVGELS